MTLVSSACPPVVAFATPELRDISCYTANDKRGCVKVTKLSHHLLAMGRRQRVTLENRGIHDRDRAAWQV